MQTIRLKSWERFGATLARLRGEAGAEVRMLFRGQGDARWPLATTLERRSAVEFDVARYVRLAAKAAPDLECLTGRSWDVPTFARLKELIRSKSETFLVHLPVLDLLVYLLDHPGEALSRDQLLQDVWEWNFGDKSTVTVHVRRLREKVEPDPAEPSRLVTVWGVGYRWEPTP